MLIINRRRFCRMATNLLSVSILPTTTLAAGGESYDPLGADQIFSRSGDDNLDRALIAELKRLVRILEINPGFKYTNAMNAFWALKSMVPGTVDGTIVLGLPLIRKLMEEDDGGASVAGICAHECGHCLQYKRGIVDRLTVGHSIMYMELHADFIAGYYMGRRAAFTLDKVKQVSKTTSSFGDNMVNSPQHHGTPDQRAAALEKGYDAAIAGNSVTDAISIGLSYVLTLQKNEKAVAVPKPEKPAAP